jgi:hypothetical protein
MKLAKSDERSSPSESSKDEVGQANAIEHGSVACGTARFSDGFGSYALHIPNQLVIAEAWQKAFLTAFELPCSGG